MGRLLATCGSFQKEITGLVYERRGGCMFHPIVDFLLAGGASVLVLVPAYFLVPDTHAAAPAMLSLGLTLSVIINYPHFAHSYQLLYTGIGDKILGRNVDPVVRLQYFWAAVLAPIVLASLMSLAYLSGDAAMLGLGVNVMGLLVGWHYVKQGYGVLIVLSVVRRIFYTAREKKVFLANAYTLWFYSWLALNSHLREERFFGVRYFTLDVPDALLIGGGVVALATSVWLAVVLVRRVVLDRQPLSVNGLVGYACPLYFWVLVWDADPVFSIFVPAFHSLQYLLIVWRYQLNKVRLESAADRGLASGTHGLRRVTCLRFGRFIAIGIALGWLTFVGVPEQLDTVVHYDPQVWGPVLFAFMFTLFINVHHYFIDNVIWRKGNNEMRTYLFAAQVRTPNPLASPEFASGYPPRR